MPDNKLILPDDPLWGQPVIMNDPYKNAVTPKMAQEQRMRELDAEREKEAKTIKGDMIKYANSAVAHAPDAWMKSAQAVGVSNIMTNPMWFSPIQTPQNWQTASKRREVYQWARFFYESEPKVAAAIDFYSRFPMNSFKLEARSPSVGSEKIMKWFKHNIVDRLDLDEQLKMISSEYFLLGDVFILREIQCPVCGGSAVDPDTGEQCNHPGGTFKRLQVLNPDWVEVRQSSITDESDIVFIPDEELQRIVFYKQPKAIYDRIPDKIKQLILSRKPIPLSSRIVTHLKHMPVPYGTYGTSLVRRLFTTLAYKTKLMTANWIVAERLILPVRVVKVGSDERPATSADIADIQQQLAATSNDPNLTIVTHNNFEYDYYGASGKILQVTQEMEYIGKEILDGFMLNQSLLNGEMCIPESDRMLTKEGFKNLSEISENDEIATFNKSNNQLEYQKPSNIHIYDYNGELTHFKTDRIDFACTPNHRMLYQKRGSSEWLVDLADNIKNRAKFRKQITWAKSDAPKNVIVGDKEIELDQYIALMSYYVTEGYTRKESRKSRRTYRQPTSVCVYQSVNGKGYEEVCDLFKSLPYKHSHSKEHCSFAIYNKTLAMYLQMECGDGSYNKHLPQWIKELPKHYLIKLLKYMINGDGAIRTRDRGGPKQYYVYYTRSTQLAYDVMEIALKCGYWPRYRHSDSRGYEISFSDYDLEKETLPLESKKYKTITKLPYKGKVWCVTVPNSFIVTERNGKLMISGNSGYQSAQVGVETLIRRIESWRNTLAKFVEEDIFKPVAEMQGFIDKKASEELGVPVYIYPKIKWNDLNLKDKSQWHQILVQLHDKQVISTQTLCEELGLNYDKEIERLRYEQARGGPMGGGLGQGGGGMGGMGGGGMGGAPMPGMDGGMGGAPMPGMDGGMGMGGAGGGMGMGGGAPMPGGGGAPAMASSGKITKKGKSKEKELSQEEIAAMTPMIKLTSIEQKMAQMLERIASNLGWTPELTSNKIRMQFPVENPTGHKPYMLDFALPEYKLGLEAEGSFWHTQPNQAEDDNKRDALLAQRGWTIIRFDDSVIEDAPQDVESTMYQYITKAIKGREEKKEGQSSFYTIYKNSMTDVYQNWPMHLGALLEEDTKC